MIDSKALRDLLDYVPETGEFFWKVRPHVHRKWRAGHIEIGRGKWNKPYRRINIAGNLVTASRVAWAWMMGEWPADEMDHIDGNSLNDAWINLRLATRQQNEINKGKYKNNKSGYRGVRFHKGKFYTAIRRNGVRVHLGCFDTARKASVAYLEKARELDGEFAHD